MEAAEPDALLAALAYDVFVLRSNTFSKADLSRVAAQGAKPARSLSLDVRVRARLARPPARFGKAATWRNAQELTSIPIIERVDDVQFRCAL